MARKRYGVMEEMPDVFHPNDYALSDLACRVAVAIDCHIKRINKPLISDYRPIVRLGKILYLSTEPMKHLTEEEWIPVRDDIGLSVFLADLLETHTGQKYSTIEDVIRDTRNIALDILKIEDCSKEKQEQLRDFCLELSRKAAYYWHTRNPHGFKRYVA